jgi:hypothetical protein
MRIAPLAFCVNPLVDESRRLIRDVSRITHHSDEAYSGALAVVLAVGAATSGGESLEWIASQIPDTSVRHRLMMYAALPEDESLAELAKRYGASGYVVESIPLALFAARQVGRLGFAGMLEQVIAAGGDTDSNASLASQVAGTLLGFRGLPLELLGKLPQAESVIKIARAFADSVASRAELCAPVTGLLMDIIVEFFGGPMDGVIMTNDSPDPLDRHKVEWIAHAVGGCLRDSEKREVPLNPGMVYTVQSDEIKERAKKEGWSDAKIAALMPKYEYEFSKVQEQEGIAHISLRFKGTS